MRIDLRNSERHKLFSVEVDLSSPPTVVRGKVEDTSGKSDTTSGASDTSGGQSVHLNWDRAIDDERHLRRCPACGCEELYVRSRFPRLTAFVMIAFAAAVAVVLLGFGRLYLTLIVLGVIVVIDVIAYFFLSDKLLVCYRCRTEFHDTPIARGVKAWQADVEERYRV